MDQNTRNLSTIVSHCGGNLKFEHFECNEPGLQAPRREFQLIKLKVLGKLRDLHR